MLNFMWLLMVAPSDDIEGKLVAQIPKCFPNLQNKSISFTFYRKGDKVKFGRLVHFKAHEDQNQCL